jgi:peptidoglycan/xylan/chitin deacetylase (PgdA/CDA1 family)
MIQISPYKSFYKAGLTISFDYETSAIDYTPSWEILYKYYLEKTNHFRNKKKKTNYGYQQRKGAELIFTSLKEYKLHATWFGTGHTLLKGNQSKKEYRINQTLPSLQEGNHWREKIRTFDDEPFSTYKKRSDYYFGDLTERLRDYGEDIQCHTFSHPILALEPIENIAMDLEDWQNAATRNGFGKAQILAFPFLADCCYYHPEIKKRLSYKIPGENWKIEPISPERINIIHHSGIELVTRCYTKYFELPFKGFKNYYDSHLFYLTTKSLGLDAFKKDVFIKNIEEIVQNGWLVDYWCHPHNIVEYPMQNFLDFLDIISKYSKTKGLWVPTIKEAWDHFKNIQNLELAVDELEDKKLHVRIINNNGTIVSDIGIDLDLNQYNFENVNGIQRDVNDHKRIVLSSIPAKSRFDFILQNKYGKPFDRST